MKRCKSILMTLAAPVLVFGGLLPNSAFAITVRVACGATRDFPNFTTPRRIVFQIGNVGTCCAHVFAYDQPNFQGNLLLDVTLCSNERVNVNRAAATTQSVRIVCGGQAGGGACILDFVPLPADSDANWARNGENIYNTNLGNVGIGTTAPGEKLTVCGTIETKSGGVKFPDGSIQTTAAQPIGEMRQVVWGSSRTGNYTVPTGRVLIVTDIMLLGDGGLVEGNSKQLRFAGSNPITIGHLNAFSTGIPFVAGEIVVPTSAPAEVWWYGYLNTSQ